MWFLPKDYVWVNTRIDKAHEKYDKNLSIETEFDIKDKTVIFTARVKIKDTEQVFTWHSFWETGKEKSFEKLETVAVWRALAFAWFETRDWIASREEMEVFDEKKNEVWAKTAKQENNKLREIIEEIKKSQTLDILKGLYNTAKVIAEDNAEKEWLNTVVNQKKSEFV